MDLQEATAEIRRRIGDDSGLNATVKLALDNEQVIVIDGASSPNQVHNTDATVKMKLSDLGKILNGRLSPTTAFMMGKLKAEGNTAVAISFATILNDKRPD